MNKNTISFIIAFFTVAVALSQGVSDTLFNSLQQNIDGQNANVDILPYNGRYLILNIQTDNQSGTNNLSIVKTNKDFEVLSQVDSAISKNEIVSARFGPVNNEKVLLFVTHEDVMANIYSYQLDIKTLNVDLIDSLEYNTESMFFYDFTKINNFEYIAFGQVYDLNYQVIDNFYLKFDHEGDFAKFEIINGFTSKEVVLNSIYMEKTGEYILSTWFSEYYMLDKNLNVVQIIENDFEVIDDGIPSEMSLSSRYCNIVNDTIYCVGRTFGGGPYSVSKIELPINEDSIGQIQNVTPLLEVNYEKFTKSTYTKKDSKGNLISVMNGDYNPFTPDIDTNALYIIKMNADFRVQWTVVFKNGNEFEIRNVEIDNKNDIIIVGSRWNSNYPIDQNRNFYLKINADGTLTSTGGNAPPDKMMVVYPNPTAGNLSIKDAINNLSHYTVYNSRGEKVKSADLQGTDNFSIRTLPAGTYFIHFMNKQGQPVKKAKVVKY